MINCSTRFNCRSLLTIVNTLLFFATSIVKCGNSIDDWCTNGGVYHGQYCYAFIKRPMIFANAKTYCSTGKGQLAKITDQETLRFIRAYHARMMRASDYWIGISDRFSEGNWIYISDNASVLIYSNWISGEPNNGGVENSNQDCGALRFDLDLHWVDRECDGRFLYICQFEDTSKNCTTGHAVNRKCYQLSKERKSFHSAEMSCIQQGGKLAEITSSSEQFYLENIIKQEGWWRFLTLEELEHLIDRKAFAWVGIQKDRLINAWVYVDGQQMTNRDLWQEEHPGSYSHDTDCVGISRKLETALCNQFFPFFCQYAVTNRTMEVTVMKSELIGGIGISAFAGVALVLATMYYFCRHRKKNSAPTVKVHLEECPPPVTPRKISNTQDHPRLQSFVSASDGYLYPKRDTYINPREDSEDHVYASIETVNDNENDAKINHVEDLH